MLHANLLPKILLDFSSFYGEYRKNLSAVLLTSNKYLWLGSDETSSIERLSLIDDNTFGEHQHYQVANYIGLPAPEDKEIDIEGLAYIDNYLWFVGSHSWKRKKVKDDVIDAKNIQRLAKTEFEANRYILGRIPLIDGQLSKSCPHPQHPDIELSAAKLELSPKGNILIDALLKDSHLGAFIQSQIPSKDNGFDLEGIVVCGNRVYLGLRGPVLRGWAIILELELTNSNSELLKLNPIGENNELYQKHFVFLNGLGIRDLCVDGENLLILAGPTMDLDGPVQVYRLDNWRKLSPNTLNKPELIMNIPFGEREEHAEGITLFKQTTGADSLLVVYDSPAVVRLVGDAGVMVDVFEFNH
jgi:Protein of unknown function (DUF3616)